MLFSVLLATLPNPSHAHTDGDLPLLTIKGTGESAAVEITSKALIGKEISVTTTPGFSVSQKTIPANSKNTKLKVTLNSSKALTKGKLILRSGDSRTYIQLEGHGTSLPTKDISNNPVYKGTDKAFSKEFNPGKRGYTIEFKVNTSEEGNDFYPYFVDQNGYGFKAYVKSSAIGLYNADSQKNLANPATEGKDGGTGKFYNNDEQSHTYRLAITPDNRAFIYRDNLPIDTVRTVDFGSQPYFATGTGDIKENLLKNGDFEGEFENTGDIGATSIEGWNIVIGDRWNSQQRIEHQELDNSQDLDNHVFEIKPYKWAGGWSDGILEQVVDVAPNQTYTLSALAKGGTSKKKNVNTGKITIQEVQDGSKRAVTEIASENWEYYSTDFTTSADCKQIRIRFSVGKGSWGGDITAVCVDNAKLTGTARTYKPKFGFENSSAKIDYFTIDTTGAYAPEAPAIQVTVDK